MLAKQFPKLLDSICQSKHIDTKDLAYVIEQMIANQISDVKIGAFLTALNAKGIDAYDLATAAEVLLAHARPFPKQQGVVVDCVGTGGDGMHTYNISTLAALVLASMGLSVAKHGNTKVSSSCGATDLLNLLGVKTHLEPIEAANHLHHHQFCYLAAPDYHPGVAHVSGARQELQSKTLFNLLGPLINPAKPTHMLIGVAQKRYLAPMAHAAKLLGINNAMIVHGSGIDEIAIHDITYGFLLKDNHLSTFEISPADLGINPFSIESIISFDPQKNKQASLDCLMGHGLPALKTAVAINAGALLFLCEQVQTIKDGYEQVMDFLSTDKAYLHLEQMVSHD